MLIASVCNPIFINTFVVFVRLYWFEKRFQNVVLEARTLRHTKARSRTRSQAKEDIERDIGSEEIGVGNREIVVLRDANGGVQGKSIEDEKAVKDVADDNSNGDSSKTAKDKDASPEEDTSTPLHRNIMFADELESPLERMPEKRSKEQNIAFVENQRNPKDTGALRIPGPRDFDRGFAPERIEESDEQLSREATNDADTVTPVRRARSNSVPPKELNQDDHPLKAHITIDAPDHRRRPHTGPSAYALNARGRTSDSEVPTVLGLRNRRSRTFGSLLSGEQEEERDPMPYLSWQPTVGRNSAFVDLTEEQREELGGIEYRSLKLLAIILVCKFLCNCHLDLRHLTLSQGYYVGFHLLGMICLLPWIVRDQKYSQVLENVNENPVWW